MHSLNMFDRDVYYGLKPSQSESDEEHNISDADNVTNNLSK